jgi:hypothetical protein
MIPPAVLGGFSLLLDRTGVRPSAACARPPDSSRRPPLRGISRDKLLAYLWPDSDSVHARNSLKQALFSLRHALDCRLLISSSGFFREL